MSSATMERTEAAKLPDGDVIAVLLTQHARIRDLFATIGTTSGEMRRKAFDELRALLAVHEVAEELIVRPVAKRTAGSQEADARNAEEAEAAEVLKHLEGLDVDSAEFTSAIKEFEKSVGDHADSEEAEEFPAILHGCTQEERHTMGERLQAAEKMAPSHPHPTAAGKPGMVALTGPFAAMMDKVRDAMGR
ncbi:hemerythrin domain-containing protein [Actinacidiphila guanduensis]|uniref:Hemerythrin HHE cation binding domain-containing protein n=1 Tax=Actinacidiphila guanduensis TaxID=310781 RepID=A0A1H0NP70_9ACTN|nr:hemerythrin domain-containing protein [Actinacidiphila guanduensis]SDO94376.1 Hemerythrin HHE cation binding domain-containing protein [Actinacidiphila guanduensis]